MATYTLKRNDTDPPVQTVLSTKKGPVNLTGCTVRFLMKSQSGATTPIDAAATIVDPLKGIAQYQWVDGDTATTGIYWVEWQVNFPTGRRSTFPSDDYLTLVILGDLN